MCGLAHDLRDELQNNNVDAMGEILHENWMLKKTLASGISNPAIDDAYSIAMEKEQKAENCLEPVVEDSFCFMFQKINKRS